MVPGSTYRLQLTAEFGFGAAAEAAQYLAELGVTHVYLSPILEAVPGSPHGYDVTDHSRIRAELGGEEGFHTLVKRLRGLGLGVVLDIVPNHMAVPANLSLNRQLWSVLRAGRESQYATWFDIDWAAQEDRMLLPLLGGPLESCLQALWVEPDGGPDGEPVLRYHDHVLPIREGTARLPLRALLESQHYRLTWWRDGDAELNWRRFFNITSLIGVRVEDPAVFDATHELIVRLVAGGLVDGLRIDHPDGLADPRGYLARLSAATDGAWVVVEKILQADEELPADWACAGTTGYETLRIVDGLFRDPAGGQALQAEYACFSRLAGVDSVTTRFADVAEAAKREVVEGTLAAEVGRLARLFGKVCPDASADDASAVLTEILTAFPVYRAYVHPGELPGEAAETAIAAAVEAAGRRLPRRLRGLTADLAAAALGLRRPVGGAAGRSGEFAVRFQQTTGPVLAKGVEDTACYRWSRLIALNEVGGDPDRFAVTPGAFHATVARLAAAWPATMTTLSTHDTKRQEDVRARLAVLAEIPARWGRQVRQWHERAVSLRLFGRTAAAVDPDTEYLLWQTIVGTWPISGDRLAHYLTKAIREAERRTSWTNPRPDYEAAVLSLAARAVDDQELRASIAGFVADLGPDAAVNSLGAKLIQLTMAGVPDVYQGCEMTALSLVDPDNRREVDYARARSILAQTDGGAAASLTGDGTTGSPGAGVLDAAKLRVTSRALRLRRARPAWFAGEYAPLAATGQAAGHLVAFKRGRAAITVATRLPAGLRAAGGWRDTVLPAGDALPDQEAWVDLITGRSYHGAQWPVADLLRDMPVALLVPEDA